MMTNSFDFFDAIYCINLDRRIDRWNMATNEFGKVGILERVQRIRGCEVDVFPEPKRNAAFGNHLSHAICLRSAREHNLKNCLIFEDDVLFINDTLKILEKATEQLDYLLKWDLFYLGANLERPCYEIYDNLANLTFAFSTHAYAVHSNLFDELIEVNESHGVIHNDVYYNDIIVSRGGSYICKPMIAIQQPSYSDIEERYVNYDWMEQRFWSNYVTKCGRSNQITLPSSFQQWEGNH